MKNIPLSLVFLVLTWICPLSSADDRPSFLIMMLDDAGWSDLSVYGSRIQTPNMDQLAAEGMRFTDCQAAAPNCSPSRIGMLTGRSPIRAGIFNYLDPGTPMHLQAQEVTIANLLRDAGYATGHFGKWHVSDLNSDQAQPPDHGFDYSLGTDNNAEPSHLNPVNFVRNGVEVGPMKGYSCDIVADEAIGWLKDHSEKKNDQPFFACVWFHEPHQKIASPPKLVADYEKLYPEIKKKEAEYLANVANADQAVGRILETLDQLDMDENTVIFLTSDNGGLNDFSNKGLRGQKSLMWEGGHREPGIFRWPAKIKAGTVSNETIGFVDVLPTFCDIAEVALPENRHIDGMSIRNHLTTGKSFTREQPLFWFFYRVNPSMAFRMGDWLLTANTTDSHRKKTHWLSSEDIPLIKSSELMDFELFNLKSDLAQTTNVIEQNQNQFKEMKALMIRYHKDIVTEGEHWDIPADYKK
ncbi:MAG: sulfatase-like hydrolase/transferase [Verrucomicrobia bacterium]|nr:sulfatase-like hydrolase/transferase [Verrucomicrobiota bacterium]MDA1068763.1 sulfatase-like hydrolase/transferase [Verrucomicrobiota bacterium]